MEILDDILIPIQTFLSKNGFIIPNWFVKLILFVLLSLTIWILNILKNKLIKYLNYLKKSKDLHPYFSNSYVKEVRKYYVPTKLRDKPPSNYSNFLFSRTVDIDTNAIDWFINTGFNDKDDARFYLILADSGMGKSAFMINLYLEYSSKLFRKYDIKLLTLGHPQTFKDIEVIKSQNKEKKTILLLDAFDEDNEALNDWKKRFEEIIDIIQGFREIVITSRTQFFPSEKDEPYILKVPMEGRNKEFHTLNKMYVSPFSDSDVKEYLNKKFGKFNPFNFTKKERANRIVAQSPNLMVRPMLLSYIDDLLQTSIKFKYVFQVYEELILKWISREANHVSPDRTDVFRDNLHKFSQVTAIKIYENWSKKRQETGLFLNEFEINKIAQEFDIKLSLLEMKSKSLLNRNALGQYKFSHKSILEFFLAQEFMVNDKFSKDFDFNGFDQAQKFVGELSEIKYVLRFLKKQKVKVYSGLFTIEQSKTKAIIKRFVKTIVLNKKQFEKLLIELDDIRFVEGINELIYENLIPLEDSTDYKIENIVKIRTLKRITIYTNVEKIHNSKLKELKTLLPNCHIPGWHTFINQ